MRVGMDDHPLPETLLMRHAFPASLLVVLLCGLLHSPVHAEVYKCSVDGRVVYQQTKCENGVVVQTPASRGRPDTAVQREQRYLAREGDRIARDEALENAMRTNRVVVGMNEDQVRRARGRPTRINASSTPRGVSAQWVYDKGSYRADYVYFQDGIVYSFELDRSTQ